MNKNVNKKRGFTIIEVVLVLAIAALIFLMIFVALPALQRGQRDTARKTDVGTIAAAVNSYRSNHNGLLPTNSAADKAEFAKYLDKLSQIEVSKVVISSSQRGSAPANIDEVTIYLKAKCDSANNAVPGSSRQAAVITKMEAGSGNVAYCQAV